MKHIHTRARDERMYWPSTIELQLFKHFRHCIRNKIFLSHICERQTKCMNVKSFCVEIHMTHSKCTEVNLALFSRSFRSKVREDLCFCFTILQNFFSVMYSGNTRPSRLHFPYSVWKFTSRYFSYYCRDSGTYAKQEP